MIDRVVIGDLVMLKCTRMNITKPQELNEKRQSCSCNAKDAVDGKPSAEDAGQETDAHPLTRRISFRHGRHGGDLERGREVRHNQPCYALQMGW